MRANPPPLQDPDAFSSLYEGTYFIIFRFIYGLHGGPIEEVEDLTCETYFKAWKGRLHFSGDERSALHWLFTIARRLVIDAHRHQKSHREDTQVRLDDHYPEAALPDNSDTPEDKKVRNEQFQQLWESLQNLPPDKRELLVMRYMLGWKVNEIASYVHMEENTVSVYIKRSLEQIRDKWPAD